MFSENKRIARYFSKDGVDVAGAFHRVGQFKNAAIVARGSLGLWHDAIDSEEMNLICQDLQQLTVLADLSRIYVDSLKSFANQSFSPRKVLRLTKEATTAINMIYRSSLFQAATADLRTGYMSTEHYFSAENERDIAKVAQAIAVLFLADPSLLQFAEEKLSNTFEKLPKDHPTKPLVAIEHTLSQVRRGVVHERSFLKENFTKLETAEEKKNPLRLATVATWFIVIGERHHDWELHEMGWAVFQRLKKNATESEKPNLENLLVNERKKEKLRSVRTVVVGALAPVQTSSRERQQLKSSIQGTIIK